jgi:hypothetical protein
MQHFQLDDEVFTARYKFQKTNMSFREALIEFLSNFKGKYVFDNQGNPLLDAKGEPRQLELFLPVSGGNDSVLVSKIFDMLGVPAKRVHQRIYARGEMQNIKEHENLIANNIEIDVFQDVDLEEFEQSDFFQQNYGEFELPTQLLVTSKMVDIFDAEKECFIISGPIPHFFKFTHHSAPEYTASLMFQPFPFIRHRVLTNIVKAFADPRVLYAWVTDPLYKETVQKMRPGLWENQYKHIFFRKHFPEIKFIPKAAQNTWNFYRDVSAVDLNAGIYKIGNQTVNCWMRRSHLRCDYDTFYQAIDRDEDFVMKRKLNPKDDYDNLWDNWYEGNDYVGATNFSL